MEYSSDSPSPTNFWWISSIVILIFNSGLPVGAPAPNALKRPHKGTLSTGTTNPSALYQQGPQTCQRVALA
ncbi:hypothetical protein PR003_g33435 [Phytophthora rubi]|uniref:Uncharacterized protein n=1 Tax=Phytophthora rubi TaxID=129364 RepID=A0A6A4ARF3_9STRA|nr:hypothetical protein PR002_g9956 [Phytophthora rubi]KAE9042822.1 hypothetical protein PR001_g6035 [Phytophthora rubi]KAE9262724.1 hypothetical protein PR003_g33435 [Phytophthora rubi]